MFQRMLRLIGLAIKAVVNHCNVGVDLRCFFRSRRRVVLELCSELLRDLLCKLKVAKDLTEDPLS